MLSGTATCTSPAPTREAAAAVRQAAPVMSPEPATTSATPAPRLRVPARGEVAGQDGDAALVEAVDGVGPVLLGEAAEAGAEDGVDRDVGAGELARGEGGRDRTRAD